MRLHQIDPAQLARAVSAAMLAHLGRLAVPLAPGAVLHLDVSDPGALGVGMTAADLVRYAQTGDIADWGDASGALDAAQSVVEALYGHAAQRLGRGPREEDDDTTGAWWSVLDPATQLGVVVRAALARAWAETGACDAIPIGWIADLAGLSLSALQKASRLGELDAAVITIGSARVAVVTAAAARRWLGARGVLRKTPAK